MTTISKAGICHPLNATMKNRITESDGVILASPFHFRLNMTIDVTNLKVLQNNTFLSCSLITDSPCLATALGQQTFTVMMVMKKQL